MKLMPTSARANCIACGLTVTGTNARIIGMEPGKWTNQWRHFECPTDVDPMIRQCLKCKKTFQTYNPQQVMCNKMCGMDLVEFKKPAIGEPPKEIPASTNEAINKMFEDVARELMKVAGKTAGSSTRDEEIREVNYGQEKTRDQTKGYVPSKFNVRNEMGVVLLFGKLMDSMGYKPRDIQAAFPDAIFETPSGQVVRVEFEYKSSNFMMHGHDPKGCDMVICWEKDKDVSDLPVLALNGYL